jgi:uncharacterized protein (TIGR03083 family)
MAWAETEAERLVDVVRRLTPDDWSRPSDCAGWDVKAVLSHVLGALEANRHVSEFVRQFRGATRAARRRGGPMIDQMTAAQVREHARLAPADIAGRIERLAGPAVRARRRIPPPVRALPFRPGPPIEGRWTVGYLVDVIMNRDYWMHRVDVSRAVGIPVAVTLDHDGRLVADVVREWARLHGQPFTLVLEGPAGGTYAAGSGGEALCLDAVEFCRILSGRRDATGLLTTEVPF